MWSHLNRDGLPKVIKPVVASTVPYARIASSGNQTIGNQQRYQVEMPVVTHDYAQMAQTAHRLTCKKAGVYLVQAQVFFAQSTVGSHRLLEIFKNDTAPNTGAIVASQLVMPGGGSAGTRVSTSTTLALVPGDYVTAGVYQDSLDWLSLLHTEGAQHMSMTYLGPGLASSVTEPGYGTAMPTSADDGARWYYPHGTGTWEFRWNAASVSPYKWEYVGGVETFSQVGADEQYNFSDAVWRNLATDGPSFTIPRTGSYRLYGSSRVYSSTPTVRQYLGIAIGDATPFVATEVSANDSNFVQVQARYNLTAGNVIKLRYAGAAVSFWGAGQGRILNVIPECVA